MKTKSTKKLEGSYNGDVMGSSCGLEKAFEFFIWEVYKERKPPVPVLRLRGPFKRSITTYATTMYHKVFIFSSKKGGIMAYKINLKGESMRKLRSSLTNMKDSGK